MTDLAYAVVLGSALGVGAYLLFSLAPRWVAPSLARRLAPYLRDISEPRGIPTAPLGRGYDLASIWHDVQTRFARIAGVSASVERRLRQSGWSTDAAAFRGRQLAWSIAGVGAGGVLLVILALTGAAMTAAWLLPPVFGVAGALLCDAQLTRAARARVARVEQELPTVLEFLTLCLSAGEGILDSLRRVSDVGSGELTAELRGVVIAVGTGSSLSDALLRLSARLELAPLSRTIDQIVAALDRGAPLAHVLHAQADDAREDAKRGLIERAGRSEIYMLMPLVFLILPLSVLFAVFPGVFLLRLGLG